MNLKISRILHAGYVFESGANQIIFDPIFENPFSKNCFAYPQVEFDYNQIKKLKPDAIFISHFHDDHFSLESLNYLDRNIPIYLYCLFEEFFFLLKELGFKYVYSLQINVSIKIGAIEVIPRLALDSDIDSLFEIKAAGINILNVVDSWIDYSTLNQLLKNTSWDMILWPFQTMRELEVLSPLRAEKATQKIPNEWIDQLKLLKPKYIIPSSCQFIQESWSWYNHVLFPISYKNFKEQVELALPEVKVIQLNPSAAVTLDKNSINSTSQLNWLKCIGDENLDYEYKSDLTPPLTSEITKNFPALSQDQIEVIYSYCKNELIKKYNSLEILDENYFNQQGCWSLAVYNHIGEVKIFYYEFEHSKLKLIQSDSPLSLSWTTEIPIYKLHSALFSGEALTSLYIRINDVTFEARVEKEIEGVDMTQDPLIRCLYEGNLGSYQKAQLIKIKNSLKLNNEY